MKGGDKVQSQKMMRGRVAMQGFTILAIYFGIFFKTKYSLLPSSTDITDADTAAAAASRAASVDSESK
jgi:hypothetical protein